MAINFSSSGVNLALIFECLLGCVWENFILSPSTMLRIFVSDVYFLQVLKYEDIRPR